ncbi:MAG TPA: hypothetical protein VM428_00915 [Microlunatus sp.]|nr:hypothetical protein [Microlunatus sp.]
MARLVTGGSRRYPEARPEHADRGWLIRLEGPGEDVLPAGVDEAGVRRSLGLDTTVEDAYLSLDEVCRISDDEPAAEALATHARRHPVARLLCHHGLAMWHGGPDPCRMLMSPDGIACLDLGQVRTMMDGLRAVEALARHVVTSSDPARPDQVAAALRWPILPGYLTKPARAETERDGELFLDRCRLLVTSSLQVLQDTSRLRHEIAWVGPRRLQDVVHAHTDLGLYANAFVRRLLRCASDQQAEQGGDGDRHDEHDEHAGPQQQRDHGRSEAGQHGPVEGPAPVAVSVGEPHHHERGQHGHGQEAGDPLDGGVRHDRLG